MNKSIFERMANQLGVNVLTCRRFYFCMIKAVLEELKDKRKVILPEFGTFKANLFRGRNVGLSKGTQRGIYTYIQPRWLLKFKPCDKLKEFILRFE